jgi:anhydro-N-acetylmuramic acid kinase
VDAALVEVTGLGLELSTRVFQVASQSYPRDVHDCLWRLGTSTSFDIRQVGVLHRLVGETMALAARQVVDQASFNLQKVLCIGCAGHSLWYEPEGRFPSTLDMGMSAVVAERTGITVISEFSARDLAAGGHGAPLAALGDYLLFRSAHENRLLAHLGATTQVTYVKAGARIQDVVAFEVGPCNLLLDELMKYLTAGRERFDAGGKHAVQGRCIDALLKRWRSNPYMQRHAPKSLSRSGFLEDWVHPAAQLAQQIQCSVHDILCTATHFVARAAGSSIQALARVDQAPTRVLLSGGGVRNGLLWHLLQQQCTGTPLETTVDVGIPMAARTSLNSAVLAALALDGVPANLPSITGASGSRLLGSVTPGSAANWARCLAWMTAHAGSPLAAAA